MMEFSQNLQSLYNNYSGLLEHINNSFLATNPVFIVSAPRSGSTLLFDQLRMNDNIWSIGRESHVIFREFPHLRFENPNFDSGCLSSRHADEMTSKLFKLAWYTLLIDKNKESILKDTKNLSLTSACFLEKTPRNSLNIPFIKAILPNARFIYLYRNPKNNVSSMIEAWKLSSYTGQFITYHNLPGWKRKNWCFLLPKNWRNMNDKPIADIAYFQWKECNIAIMKNIKKLNNKQWIAINYKDLIKSPETTLKQLSTFLNPNQAIQDQKFKQFKLSKTTVSSPNSKKWKKHKEEMNHLFPEMKKQYKKIKQFCNTRQPN